MPEQLTAPAEHDEAEAILERSIQAEQEEGKQRIGEFTDGVEARVDEELANQTEHNITAIASETHSLVKEYVNDTEDTLGAEHMIGDTASKGAAAWNDKGKNNEIVFDFASSSLERDEGYWERVRKHEEFHQTEQAESFDMSEISLRDKQIPVSPNLTEWGAITRANQPSSDLTAEYQAYKAQGDELAEFLGSSEPIFQAIKSGKMSELQALIDRKIVEELYGNMGLATTDTRTAEDIIVTAA